MAQVVLTLRIMPNDINVNLSDLEKKAKKEIIDFCDAKEFKIIIEPIAFGIKALNVLFVMDENKGSTEELEKKIGQISGVESVEVIDVRRAVG